MRTLRLLSLAILALLFLTSCSEPDAYHYKAYGKVVDINGQPIAGVKVVLSGFDLERVRSLETLTDEDGSFSFTFDINPFEWRQEAHWVFHLSHEAHISRFVNYPEFAYDDRFKYQGYWYEVYFRGPVTMKPQPTEAPAENTVEADEVTPPQ